MREKSNCLQGVQAATLRVAICRHRVLAGECHAALDGHDESKYAKTIDAPCSPCSLLWARKLSDRRAFGSIKLCEAHFT